MGDVSFLGFKAKAVRIFQSENILSVYKEGQAVKRKYMKRRSQLIENKQGKVSLRYGPIWITPLKIFQNW